MTDTPDPCDLAARARHAYARSIADRPADGNEPVDNVKLARIEAALRLLPDLDRQVFLAVRLDAMTYEAVARHTGLSVRQVERRVARALRAIDAYLHDRPVRDRRRWWPF